VTEDVRPQDGVADGVDRQLDPRYIPLQQKIGWIVAVVMAGASFIAALIVWASAGFSLLVLAAVAAWPAIAYRHTSYRVDARGIEIRSGVYWRTIVNVPTSRVQHTDVSQGPLERTHGLGTLVIYTAGTDHSRVDLPGLAHERALQIREHLLPREESDAV
jgi:membrane protein YdbS with pleckstrin-like domain